MDIITLIHIKRLLKKMFLIISSSPIFDYINDNLKKEHYLSQVEFHVVDHCNLNCEHCDHFTPLSPEKFMTVEEVLSDFKKLKKVYQHIGKIYILGGEPLLHPHLTDFFEPLANLYPKSELILITNGILLNKQSNNFWEQIKKYNISISMTKYPIKVNYDEIINFLKSKNIKTYFFNGERTCMNKLDLDYKGRYNSSRSFEICYKKNCHFIRDGKLYLCTLVPNIQFLNKFFNINFPINPKDYIDLDKVKSPSKINKFLNKEIPFCKYCPDYYTESKEHRVSKKLLSEWVKEETID